MDKSQNVFNGNAEQYDTIWFSALYLLYTYYLKKLMVEL